MNDPVISIDDPQVIPLSPEKIAQERAAYQAKQTQLVEPPDNEPQPPSDTFNTMVARLEQALREVPKDRVNADKSAVADTTEKPKTDSRIKPTEAQKQAAATPADDPAEKTITSAKAADWKAAQAAVVAANLAAKDWEQKLEEKTKEYKEYRKISVDAKQLEKARSEAKAIADEKEKLQDELHKVALERSPKFNDFFQKKFEDATARIRDAVGTENADRTEQLMKLPPSTWRKERLNEIREEISGFDAGQFDVAISEFDSARRDRDEQIKNSKENYKKLQEIELQAAESSRLSRLSQNEASAAKILAIAREAAPSFKPGDDAEHNAFVQESEQFLNKFFKNELSDTDLAMLPVMAREARRLGERVVPSMAKKISELEAALKNYQRSSPTPSSGKDAASNSGTLTASFIDKFNELWPQGSK